MINKVRWHKPKTWSLLLIGLRLGLYRSCAQLFELLLFLLPDSNILLQLLNLTAAVQEAGFLMLTAATRK